VNVNLNNASGLSTTSKIQAHLTHGCPKNQNKCWYKTGFPPPETSKKELLILRSNNSIVRAPARTGSLKTSKKTATTTLQTKSETCSKERLLERMFQNVLKKLIPPIRELTPAT